MPKKGSQFEREICKLFSLWWTKGKRDDVFWRTSNSGGRATVRSRQGRQTFGQCGDIQATDPIGQPFIDQFSIELKRGYPGTNIATLLDKPDGAAIQPFEKFIEQAIVDHKKAKSHSWLLIVKRDRRKPIVYMPWKVFKKFKTHVMTYSYITYIGHNKKKRRIAAFQLEDFLKINPKHFK